MKESKRRRSLSGAVLIMVLTVMFVLIILLTATLTTVTTANQRIYTKFEENQAYYTARSALDVFTQNMLNDGNYDSPETFTYWDSKAKGGTGEVNTVNMKQGLALQLDFYELKSVDGMNIAQSNFNNAATGVNEWEQYKHYYGVIDTNPPTEYVYEVEFPKIDNGSNDYGKMNDSSTKATITVEVLEREYSMGDYTPTSGPNTGRNIKDYVATLNDASTPTKTQFFTNVANLPDITKAIINGNRKDDKMKVKITASTIYGGVEGLATVIIDTSKPPVTNTSRAVTTFGGSGSDNMTLVGGSASIDDVNWSNQGNIHGSVYAEKDFSINTGSQCYLNDDDCFFVGGDINYQNNNFKAIGKNPSGDGDRAPFVYIGGKLKSGNFHGTSFQDMDVIVHGIDLSGGSFSDNGNDYYCIGDFKPGATNTAISGNLYIQGNIYATCNNSGFSYDAGTDVCSIGSVTGSVRFSGNVYDSVGNDVTTQFLAAAAAASANIQKDPTLRLENANDSDNKIPQLSKIKDATLGDKKIQATLPNGLKKQIPTNIDSFNDYYRIKDDGSGEKITNPSVQILTAEELAFVSPEDRKLGVTTSTTFEDFYTNASPEAITMKFSNELGWHWGTSSTDFTKSAISPTDTEQVCMLSGGSYQLSSPGMSAPAFYCTSDTDIFLAPGGYNNLKIFAAEGATVRVFGTVSNGTYSFQNCMFSHRDIYNKINASPQQPVYVGMQGADIIIPNFQFFFGNGSKLKFDSDNTCITGYIQSPQAEVELVKGRGGLQMIYNDQTPAISEQIRLIGSVLCNELKAQQQPGIAYINPDADSSKPGMPHLTIKPNQYVRS